MEDRYGHMDKKDAFNMGRMDSMKLGMDAHLERQRRKKLKKKNKYN